MTTSTSEPERVVQPVSPLSRLDVVTIASMPAQQLPGALAHLAALQAAIAARLAQEHPVRDETEDRLLDVENAGRILGVSSDTLYSSPALKSLRVKVAGRVLFSSKRIQLYIARMAGR